MPWHSYHRCQRTHKVISNPLARYMYPLQLITSDNIEIGNLYTNSSDPRSTDIDEFVRTQDLSLLIKHNITDILYTNLCADFMRYEWITQHSGLQLTHDEDDLQVYRIKNKK